MEGFKKEFEKFKKAVKFDIDSLEPYFETTEQALLFNKSLFMLSVFGDFPKNVERHIREAVEKNTAEIEKYAESIETEAEKNKLFAEYKAMLHINYIETIIKYYKEMCSLSEKGKL